MINRSIGQINFCGGNSQAADGSAIQLQCAAILRNTAYGTVIYHERSSAVHINGSGRSACYRKCSGVLYGAAVFYRISCAQRSAV